MSLSWFTDRFTREGSGKVLPGNCFTFLLFLITWFSPGPVLFEAGGGRRVPTSAPAVHTVNTGGGRTPRGTRAASSRELPGGHRLCCHCRGCGAHRSHSNLEYLGSESDSSPPLCCLFWTILLCNFRFKLLSDLSYQPFHRGRHQGCQVPNVTCGKSGTGTLGPLALGSVLFPEHDSSEVHGCLMVWFPVLSSFTSSFHRGLPGLSAFGLLFISPFCALIAE